MTFAVLTKSLRDNRRGLLTWILGITLAATAYASFYPRMAKSGAAQVASLPDGLRQALRMDDIGSAPGYLGSSVFGLIVPLLAMSFGIVLGARATAADEESGTLDLLLAHPVTRTQVLLQRFGALALAATGLGLAVWLSMVAVRVSAGLTAVSPLQFAAQCVNLVLFTLVFGALAVGVGAATGRKDAVVAIATTAGVAAYAAHSFGAKLGVAWTERLSPFHYYLAGEPLRNGFGWLDVTVLTVTALVFLVLGVYRFNRRDLGR